MNNMVNKGDRVLVYVVSMAFGIILGVLIGYSPYGIVALLVGVAVIAITVNNPIKALGFLIIMSPFAGTIYLREAFLDIAGFKPMQIMASIVMLFCTMKYSFSIKMPRWVFYSSIAIIGIFTISIIRSIPYLDLYNQFNYPATDLSTKGYILSAYVKPLIYFLPFVVIVKFGVKKEDIAFIMNIVYVTIILLSIHILYLYVFQMRSLGFEGISNYYETYYGLHRNDLATFYVIGVPISLTHIFFNRKISDIIFHIFIFFAIGILFSRTAYITTVLAIFMYFVILKRSKILMFIVMGLIIVPIIFLGGIAERVTERATTGIKTKSKDVILSSRLDSIWIPLVREYIENPKKVLIGNGRYSILASKAREKGYIWSVIGHPHNMYLEMIIDAGLIGIIIYSLFYYKIVRNAVKTLRFLEDERIKEYIYANLLSIISFAVCGLTGRSLFPRPENIFIWIILGCTIAVCEISAKNRFNKDEANT